MKIYDYPEFLILHRLRVLQKKHPEIGEIGEIIDETLKMINANYYGSAQGAQIYIFGDNDPGVMDEGTRGKLLALYEAGVTQLKKPVRPEDGGAKS